MSTQDLQEEELEVLHSIYDGDECFKEISPTMFQYMIGDKGDPKSFLLEICWGKDYPDCEPQINMDTFYNKHIIQEVKDEIISKLSNEAAQLVGTAMTYNLIEWAKENHLDLTKNQPDKPPITTGDLSESTPVEKPQTPLPSVKQKKPQLTKQQKRKLANRMDAKGEMPRGWNWVDVVKHLSQGSGKHSAADGSTTQSSNS